MKTILWAVALIIVSNTLYSQNLYPEKFEDCKLASFCLDCGSQKAQPPKSIIKTLLNGMGDKNLAVLKGTIDLQILIDQNGKPCLLSAENKTNISSADLKLKGSVNGGENWTAATTGSKTENSSVSIILKFENGKYEAKRRVFDFANQANMSSKGTPGQKGSDKAQLTENWQLYEQANSELPWDMTRAVASDQKGDVWIGTDNGIVKITNGKWEHYNSSNTIIASIPNNKKETKSVRDMVVDQKDNKWFVIGYEVYKYDNHIWSKFDSLNSPINWARTSYADHLGNVFFTSWRGVAKFDGEKWSQLTKKNAKLPSDKTLGVFVDSKERTWIGTFEGNVMIEKGKTTVLNDKSSPLSKAYISKMHEDKKGNLWFSLHNEEGTAAGIYKLSLDGKWERLLNDDQKMFVANSINEFFLDEQNGTLWVSQNNVGILKYTIASKKLEIYTNENSNVPSVHVAQITKDKDGAIWAATFAGVIKTVLK